MVASRPSDIYGILGIAPEAGSALAREMYWRKVAEQIEAEQRGDPDARSALDELNAALAVVLDDRLRAEYDAQHSPVPPPESTPIPPAGGLRRMVLAAALVLATALATYGLYVSAGSRPAVVTAGVGLIFLGLAGVGMRREQRQASSAFAFLHLPEHATIEHLQAAYHLRAQDLLSQVRYSPTAVRQLEILDQAYLRAAGLASVRAQSAEAAQPARPSVRMERLAHRLRSEVTATIRPVVRGARISSLALARRATRWEPRPRARWRGFGTMLRSPVSARMAEGHAAQTAEGAIDVQRRLQVGFRVSTEAIAAEVTAEDVAVPEADLPAAYIHAEGLPSAQRVPVLSAPILIGTAHWCDLVLPSTAGVSPEHLLIWRRGMALLLHVTDGEASCLVNDRPVTWAVLEDGDIVHVGPSALRIEVASN